MLYPTEMIDRFTVLENNKILKICEPLFKTFGVDFLYYNHISNEGNLTSIGTHIEWMKYYYSHPLWRANPLFSNPTHFQTCLYFIKPSDSENLLKTQQISQSKYKLFISCIYIIKSSQGCTQFGLSLNGPPELYQARIVNEMALLQKFFQYFEESLKSLISKAKDHSVNLRESRGQNFFLKPDFINVRLEVEAKRRFLETISNIDLGLSKTQFTPREKECAQLIAQDLTAVQIAQSLQLAPRTVEFYIENIRQKTGSPSRGDLRKIVRTMKDFDLL